MFVGREKEIQTLNRLYSTDKFEFVVIYGRRRVGKTAIINEFVTGKSTISFTGVETNEKQKKFYKLRGEMAEKSKKHGELWLSMPNPALAVCIRL